MVIPAELLSRLQQLAGDHERTLSAEIRHAIRTYLRIIERQEQQQNR